MKFGLIALSLLTALAACGKKPESKDGASGFKSPAAMATVIEFALTSLTGAADEIEDEPFTDSPATASGQIQSFAACPGRAGSQSCTGSSRTIRYGDCDLPDSRGTLGGDVTLNFSNSSCALDTAGHSAVTRVNTKYGRADGEVVVSSLIHVDYRKRTTGGGVKIIREMGREYSAHILGLRKVFAGVDLSIKSTLPSEISTAAGLLERNGRVVRGGTIEVANNSSKYVVNITVNQLNYEASCCYPTSGTATLRYSGGISGPGTVNFTGCGSGVFTAGGKTTEFKFRACE